MDWNPTTGPSNRCLYKKDNIKMRVSTQVLESVKRRHILFNQQPASTSSTHLSFEPTCSNSTPLCPVCNCPLPADEGEAEAHVEECLSREGGGTEDSSDSETYEEYTWCDETRIRATSMLTPQARASKNPRGVLESPSHYSRSPFRSPLTLMVSLDT